jgi:hypothetical protein
MTLVVSIVVALVICLVLFPREISRNDLNPLVVALLVVTLLILSHGSGKVVELGPSLWKSYWLPQMLGIVIIFLLIVVPGPKVLQLLKDYRSAAYRALTSTVISILTCVLVAMITLLVVSRGPVTPLFLNW